MPNSTGPTDTAHQAWDDVWSDPGAHGGWVTPEPEVVGLDSLLGDAGVQTVLDLGCGVGRHALDLAARGYRVWGVDASRSGLRVAARESARRGLARSEIRFSVGSMTALPWPDEVFDHVLAWNVIYHGDGDVVRAAIAEIARVLRPRGVYQGTMIAKSNARHGKGRQIAPDTFVEAGGEKAHPHFYCDRRDLEKLFGGWEFISLAEREQGVPGSAHWDVVLQRPDPRR